MARNPIRLYRARFCRFVVSERSSGDRDWSLPETSRFGSVSGGGGRHWMRRFYQPSMDGPQGMSRRGRRIEAGPQRMGQCCQPLRDFRQGRLERGQRVIAHHQGVRDRRQPMHRCRHRLREFPHGPEPFHHGMQEVRHRLRGALHGRGAMDRDRAGRHDHTSPGVYPERNDGVEWVSAGEADEGERADFSAFLRSCPRTSPGTLPRETAFGGCPAGHTSNPKDRKDKKPCHCSRKTGMTG